MAGLRVVSLVPSLTETLVHFGLLDALVGRTDYCVEPAGCVEAVAALGGTKNPDLGRIVELRPDLVLVNKEENRIEDCRALEAAGLSLHVSHPRSLPEAIVMIEELGTAVGAEAEAEALAAKCRAAMAEAEDAATGSGAAEPTFCPIWRRPWMSFSDRTYIGDMLARSGGRNVFGSCCEDFFELSLGEIAAASAGLLLMPSEPYEFKPEHAAELSRAGVGGRAVFVDGMDLAWYGPRIPGALARLRAAVAGRG